MLLVIAQSDGQRLERSSLGIVFFCQTYLCYTKWKSTANFLRLLLQTNLWFYIFFINGISILRKQDFDKTRSYGMISIHILKLGDSISQIIFEIA